MTPPELFRVRIALVQAVLANQNLDGVLLNRVDNFAAATVSIDGLSTYQPWPEKK